MPQKHRGPKYIAYIRPISYTCRDVAHDNDPVYSQHPVLAYGYTTTEAIHQSKAHHRRLSVQCTQTTNGS